MLCCVLLLLAVLGYVAVGIVGTWGGGVVWSREVGVWGWGSLWGGVLRGCGVGAWGCGGGSGVHVGRGGSF